MSMLWKMHFFPVVRLTPLHPMYARRACSSATSYSMQTPVPRSQPCFNRFCSNNWTSVPIVLMMATHNFSDQVPLRQKSINDLGERYYSTPSRFHDRVRVAIAPDWHVSCDAKKVKPVSPLENVMAFVLPLNFKTMMLKIKLMILIMPAMKCHCNPLAILKAYY